MPGKARPLSIDGAALIAVLLVFVGMYAMTFWAVFYHRRQLEKRFKDGPWTESIVQEVVDVGSPKGHPEIRVYEAKIAFPNLIAGRIRQCVGIVSVGTHGDIEAGERLRIAPREGTCGDIATAFD